MISVEQALILVDTHTKATEKTTTITLPQSLGYVLAKDIVSPINMPPFRQSAMDGYALGSTDEKKFSLVGEVQAGDDQSPTIVKGEAVRIFTGAPVPFGAKAVVMQEKVSINDTQVILQESASINSNIRPEGEQIKKGEVALIKGTVITPAGIGYLATLGITHVEVYQKPSIAVIATGNELIPPGQTLKHGQIYESNSIMLSTALQASGYTHVDCHKVEDNYEATKFLLQNVIAQYDVVLISGGISVGDYDFVGKALRDLEVEEIFYKVKQKPGKPLYFAKKNYTTIFALPGNPASSLSCFYIYALPMIKKISGYAQYKSKLRALISNSEYSKKGQRAEFLKAKVEGEQVTILDGQASSMLRSFALSNVLVYLPEEISEIKVGDPIQIINLA